MYWRLTVSTTLSCRLILLPIRLCTPLKWWWTPHIINKLGRDKHGKIWAGQIFFYFYATALKHRHNATSGFLMKWKLNIYGFISVTLKGCRLPLYMPCQINTHGETALARKPPGEIKIPAFKDRTRSFGTVAFVPVCHPRWRPAPRPTFDGGQHLDWLWQFLESLSPAWHQQGLCRELSAANASQSHKVMWKESHPEEIPLKTKWQRREPCHGHSNNTWSFL